MDFAVKIDQFIGGEQDGGADFQQAVIRKCFNGQFGSDTIQVSDGNAYNWSLLWDAHVLIFDG